MSLHLDLDFRDETGHSGQRHIRNHKRLKKNVHYYCLEIDKKVIFLKHNLIIGFIDQILIKFCVAVKERRHEARGSGFNLWPRYKKTNIYFNISGYNGYYFNISGYNSLT